MLELFLIPRSVANTISTNQTEFKNSHKRIHMLKENRFDWWIVEWCFQHLKALASNWSKASSFGRAECKRIHGLRVWSWKPLVQVLNPWRDPLVLGKCRKCLFCLQTPGQRSPFCQHLPLRFLHTTYPLNPRKDCLVCKTLPRCAGFAWAQARAAASGGSCHHKLQLQAYGSENAGRTWMVASSCEV